MKEKIKLLEQKIENTLLKLSLNSELNHALKILEKNYLSMKKDISSMSNDFKLREYYALLLSFNETDISYAMNLVANKKSDKSIYDSSDNKIDENIVSKEKELETLVTYLKKEFPMVGDILEKRLINLKEEYSSNLKSGFSERLALVKNSEDLCGYIDKARKEVIKCQYSYAVGFREGLAIAIDVNDNLYVLSEPKTNNISLTEFSQMIEYRTGKIYK